MVINVWVPSQYKFSLSSLIIHLKRKTVPCVLSVIATEQRRHAAGGDVAKGGNVATSKY
jgi:hypothetical protein